MLSQDSKNYSRPHIWIPPYHSLWICPRGAQWVAEDQCEPECIIRNIIDNTFYNKNVVVSNPHNPLLARINPTDFRDFFASCLTHSRWEPRLAAENIWWTSSTAQSLHSSLDFKYISGLIHNCCLSGGFMNRACRWRGAWTSKRQSGMAECNVCDSWWHLMLTVGQIRIVRRAEREKWVRRVRRVQVTQWGRWGWHPMSPT